MFDYNLNELRPLIGVVVLAILALSTLKFQLRSRQEDELLDWASRAGTLAERTSRSASPHRRTR